MTAADLGSSARRVELSELPRWSPWPARLLGLAPWKTEPRTPQKVEREYDRDKYLPLLRALQEEPSLTLEELRAREYGMPPSQAVCVSLGNELFETTLAQARQSYQNLLVEVVGARARSCRSVVELGAGYGFNLRLLCPSLEGKMLLGGEFSANGRAIAERFGQDGPGVLPFDFYDREAYAMLERAKEPLLVFTVYAIHQLPRMGSVLDCLTKYRDRIAAVVHLEPAYELHGDDLLGLLRRRYVEVNDYNTDLVSQLRSRSRELRVVRQEADVFGLNPLHPLSVVEWEFV